MDNLDLIEQLAARARQEPAPTTSVRGSVMRRLHQRGGSVTRPWSLFAGMSAAAAVIVLGLALATSQQASAASDLFPAVETVTPW